MLVSLILVINFCVYVSSTHQNCKSTHLKGLDGSIGFNTQCEIRLLNESHKLLFLNQTKHRRNYQSYQFKNNVSNVIFQPNLIESWKSFPLILTNSSDISKPCEKSTQRFIKSLKNYELWALKMLDATAKLPSGILSGNLNQFGDFDECLSVEHAQYCLTELNLDSLWQNHNLPYKNLIYSHLPFKGSFDAPQHRVPDFSMIRWGVCLPSDCTANDLRSSIERNLGVLAKVRPSMCKKSIISSTSLTFGDYFSRSFFVVLLLAVTISTVATYCNAPFLINSENIFAKLLLSFAIQNSWRHLTNTVNDSENAKIRTQNQIEEIKSVHGIRALSALALYICHKSVALLYNPFINRTPVIENFGKPWTVIARTAIVHTDSFMLISGLLTAHTFLRDLELHGNIKFKEKLINRIFRITPNLVVLILFCTYILPNISSGPLWPLVIEQHANLCKQHMWRNIFFIHNHFGFENMCLTHTHQVGIDMQLFIFSPLLIYLCHYNKKLGFSFAFLITILSTFLRYFVTIQHNLSHMIYYGIPVAKMFDTANFSYILPTHRATIYVIGILLAYLLRNKTLTMNKIQVTLTWIMAVAFGVLATMGPFHMARMTYKYYNVDAAIYGAISPVLWGICLSWAIFASNRGYAGWLGDLLSWKYFELFTKIAYTFYLIQFPVFFYNVGVQRNAEEFRPHVLLHLSETLIVLFLSIFLTLVVEIPFQKIYGLLFKSRNIRSKTEKNNNKLT